MQEVIIATVQMNCQKGKISQNLSKIDAYIKNAVENQADFICFPEMSITGYINPKTKPESVLTLQSNAVSAFCRLTSGTAIVAIAGIVEKNPSGKPFITQIVAANGELLGYYRKVYVADDEKDMFDSASERPVFNYNDTPFAVAICADTGHGDLLSDYAKQGAKIVFAPSAPGLYGPQEGRDWQGKYEWWRNGCEKNLGKFSKENHIVIAVATQSGRTEDEDFPGGGYIFNQDGVLVAGTQDWSENILYAKVSI